MIQEFHQDKRLFRINDVFDIRHLSEIRLSPDGENIACVTTTADLNKNTRQNQITIITTKDKEVNYIAEGSSPLWSPDGSRIAYHGSEQGQSGIWIYDLADRRKKLLTPTYHSAYFVDHLAENNFVWAPDGRYVAYVSTPPFSQPESADEEQEIKVIDRLLYKTKGGSGRPFFADDHLTHVWIIPATGGAPELITPGQYNEHSISWSPDSLHIAFISNRTSDPDNNQRNDLWTVAIRTKEVTRLTAGPGTAFQPRWSPDGRFVAYLATPSKVSTNDSQSDDMHLFIAARDGSKTQRLTGPLDRRIENIQWHPRQDSIYFTAGNEGSTPLYKASLTNQNIERILDDKCHISEYSLSADGETIAYLKGDITHPAEIFITDSSQTAGIKITSENQKLLDQCRLQQAEEFWFDSFDETPVQGWIIRPSIFDPSKRYPLILIIHGGPHNMYGYNFDAAMQLLSAHGYAVVFMNPRGSSGYGQNFSNGNVLNWGGGDYKDLMAGLDHIINTYEWIDENNLGVTGQSYGGYMTNWIITQTDRFKAAIVDGGISNLISFSGTSLYHSLMESEFGGSIYDNFPLLWQWSPLRNVKNVRTPTLFLHGGTDNEVPVTQAEEMYVALKKLGIRTSLVQYLKEGHGWRPDLKPGNRYDLLKRMLKWFDQYLQKDPSGATVQRDA